MEQHQAGTLYICGTPIGNLEDITYRAVRVLQEADLIAAEDTRHTRKLLSHFSIHTPLISYHEHNKQRVGTQLIERLLSGQTIALVSDAGMPGIADPGSDLVAAAIAAGILVVPIPGANAALSALVASGLDTRNFMFVGFLPKTSGKRRIVLNQIIQLPASLIFYEAPHRLLATLQDLQRILGDRQVTLARELTKRYEQFIRGTLSQLSEHFRQTEPRGECTLIVAGSTGITSTQAEQICDPVVAVNSLMAEGMHKKDAIRKVASEQGLSRRVVYKAVLETSGSCDV